MKLTQAETARRLGVHPNTVANMLRDGRLVAVVVGNEGGPNQPTRRVDAASLSRLQRKLHAEAV